VPLESLACGTPVVATDVGDLKNIILPGVTGDIAAGNTHDIAEKIVRVLSWEISATTRNAIRESVAHYSWQSVARQLERECRHLVAENGVLTY